MYSSEFGVPVLVECTFFPEGYVLGSGLGVRVINAHLYCKGESAYATHCTEEPLQGTVEEVTDAMATAIIARLRSKSKYFPTACG
ncbi:MAG: hypothetical protein V1885_01900 [Candidatus Brennerbacteria bacterium]